MDDPWGSPWADEVQHPVAAKEVKDDRDQIEVRPKTPVKAATLGLADKTNSPWDDEDDGFGEWAAVPTVEEVRGNALGFDGTGDTWDSRDAGDNKVEIKSEFNGLSPSWNDHTPLPVDDIPKLASSLMPKSAPIVRQPSPDPWATETTLNDGGHKEDNVRLEEQEPAMEGTEDLFGEKMLADEDALPVDRSPDLDETITEKTTSDDRSSGKSSPDVQEHISEPLHEPAERIPEVGIDESDEEDVGLETEKSIPEPTHSAEEQVNGHESSRPSSSPSDQSHHDETLVESPRTSLDEEPKRPRGTRKVSSKIQDLVEHFDGLAKQEEDIAIEPSPSRSRSKTPSLQTEKIAEVPEEPTAVDDRMEEVEEGDDDFGDFEDGQSEVEEPIEEVEVKRPVTPTSPQSQIASSPVSKMASPHQSPPRSRYAKKDYGRVEYVAGASALDNFYSQSGGDAPKDAPVEKVFIMDAIPFDSFQSLEERKTWYRISRYGSMRKHNSGDDDNYIRVTWPQSQVREQTLKTVARWMEEDRISGRVVLGGGSKGSSIFGWNDPNAPAVPLASAFAAKQGRRPTPANASVEAAPKVPREWPKGLVRDRSTSQSRSSSKSRRRSSAKSTSISESYKGSPQAPVANFGWSASPTTKEQSPIPLAKEVTKVAPTSMKPSSPPPQSGSLGPRPPASFILIPGKATELKKPADANGLLNMLTGKPTMLVVLPPSVPASDVDDDWGEMVASPVVSTSTVLPPIQGLRHKKSQSLSGAFSPPLQASPIDSPISPRSASGHKSAMSFDDILAPKPRNSLDSKSDSFPLRTSTMTAPVSFSNSAFQPSPSSVTSAASNSDPWASADFSIFDSPASAPAPTSAPAPAPNLMPAPATKLVPPKSVTFAKAPPAPSPLRHGKTRQEIEQDEIVAGIVKSLPDLSYMLRR